MIAAYQSNHLIGVRDAQGSLWIRPHEMARPPLNENFQCFLSLQWNSLCNAMNFRDATGQTKEETQFPIPSNLYPDMGESGDTYDEEMASAAKVANPADRGFSLCPTCGQRRPH